MFAKMIQQLTPAFLLLLFTWIFGCQCQSSVTKSCTTAAQQGIQTPAWTITNGQLPAHTEDLNDGETTRTLVVSGFGFTEAEIPSYFSVFANANQLAGGSTIRGLEVEIFMKVEIFATNTQYQVVQARIGGSSAYSSDPK